MGHGRWNIRRSLKRLRHGANRLRFFRGHGVHSPYIYKVFREVFMSSRPLRGDNLFVEVLKRYDLSTRVMRELGNLSLHCGFSRFAHNGFDKAADMIVCDKYCSEELFGSVIAQAADSGKAVLIISPHQNERLERFAQRAIAKHNSTSVDRYDYILIFNNHLPKQHFRL